MIYKALEVIKIFGEGFRIPTVKIPTIIIPTIKLVQINLIGKCQ